MMGRSRLLHRFGFIPAAAMTFALVAICAGTLAAQSGRRVSKSTPAPAPSPQSPESPQSLATEKKPSEAKPALSFIIGIEQRGHFADTPLYFFESVLRAAADRLDDAPSVKVDIAHRDMSRGDAVKRAKAENEAFVVWMQLRIDSMRSGSASDLSQLYIEYWVFAPGTAKIATSGHTYQQTFRSGPIVLAPGMPGRNNPAYAEQLLKQAARDAAARILAAVRDYLPGDRVPG